MMLKETIVTKTKQAQPRIYNMMSFIKTINRPYVIILLRMLEDKPQSYTELKNRFGLPRSESSKFAFYLRRLKTELLIQKDGQRSTYFLTYKGTCAVRLLESIEKIANFSMDNLDDVTAKLTVSLEQNKDWLRPLIQSEIRLAVKQLTNRRIGSS